LAYFNIQGIFETFIDIIIMKQFIQIFYYFDKRLLNFIIGLMQKITVKWIIMSIKFAMLYILKKETTHCGCGVLLS